MVPHRTSHLSSQKVIYAALVGNLLVAATKFGAAGWTDSSALLSEAVHSLVDTGNSLLLLYGLHRAKARPDRKHPLGYGREIYFWSFVVAVMVFAVGAGVSFYQGVIHVLHPELIRNAAVAYTVIALSALFDGTTWWIALRAFKGRMPYSDLFGAIQKSKDPPSFMVLFEDSASLIGLSIAFAGTYLSVRLGLPIVDGIASILISVVLAVTAVLLARETKGLLLGESADQPIVNSIMGIANRMEGVAHANGVITVHLAPKQIIIALSLEFSDELRTPEIEFKVIELERQLRKLHPEVIAVFVKPQSSSGYKDAIDRVARMKCPEGRGFGHRRSASFANLMTGCAMRLRKIKAPLFSGLKRGSCTWR
jgi:cation diffusion facilitator family transporter